jgi:hypothetical protein
LPNLIASLESALPFFAGAALVVYLIFFFRLVSRYPDDVAILRADGRGKRGNLILTPVILIAVLAPMPYKAIALGIGIPLLIGLSWVQHIRLTHAGASTQFLRRLGALSCLGTVAMIAFAASMLLGSLGTSGS